ncbi:hypothetical protein OG225_00775 [Nocardia sp. NBC_01377]|uniref:hypothetical protein n=1 Tax=Nocardia sp. NBC_01377 TaxID=2903595 RepID=UPI00324A493B
MVSPDTALRRLLRETGKLLEPYGFGGSEPTWIRVEPGGVASVGRTRVSRTWTDGQQTLRFGLRLDAAPAAWWEFRNWRDTRLGLAPTSPENATGPGLVEPHPPTLEPPESWSLRVDPERAGQHAAQADIDVIRAELPRRVHAYARRAIALIQPDRYLDELLAHPEPDLDTRRAIVVLLADRGPGPELDDAIHLLRQAISEQEASEYVEEVVTYARTRAALV